MLGGLSMGVSRRFWVLDAQGNPAQGVITGWKYLDFPLYVGKEWSQTHEGRLTSGSRGTSLSRDRFKVMAYEEVSGQAGTFKAFRIRHHQENLRSGWSGENDRWWSPEARAYIKQAVYASRDEWGGNWELKSYTLK